MVFSPGCCQIIRLGDNSENLGPWGEFTKNGCWLGGQRYCPTRHGEKCTVIGKECPRKAGDIFILTNDPQLNVSAVLCQIIGRDFAKNLLKEILPYLQLAPLIKNIIQPILIILNQGLRQFS